MTAVILLYVFVKMYQIACLKLVNFILYKVYLNIVDERKKIKKKKQKIGNFK